MTQATTVIVVPCYNEAKRLQLGPFVEMLRASGLAVLFVDDGSTDDTRRQLEVATEAEPDRLQLLALPRNVGKAEAVRAGLAAALCSGATIVGYLDADLAAPPAEMLYLLEVMTHAGVDVVLGSRVKRLGAQIRRNELRHYVGRVFATGASLVLDMPVYDTQCGAKVFRVNEILRAALTEPFLTRWVFDVELLQRLRYGCAGVPGLPVTAFLEVPLRVWLDIEGSKVHTSDGVRALWDLARLAVERRSRK